MWSEQLEERRNLAQFEDNNDSNNNNPQDFDEKPSQGNQSEPALKELAGFGVGFFGVVGEILLSHPFIIIRRQCQVRSSSGSLHIVPFTLLPVLRNLYVNQGFTTFWKGLTSSFIVHGFVIVVESLVSEVHRLPKEITKHTSTKRVLQHLILKLVSWSVVTPVYASHVIESVQSDIASVPPGTFSCIQDSLRRFWIPRSMFRTSKTGVVNGVTGALKSKISITTTRLLPYWSIVGPIVALNVGHYIIRGFANIFLSNYLSTVYDNSFDSAGSTFLGSESLEQRNRRLNPLSSEHDWSEVNQQREEMALQSQYMKQYRDLLSGMWSSLIADVILFPLETIVVRLCVQGTRTLIDNSDTGDSIIPIVSAYEGVSDVIQESTTSSLGFASLYRGFGSVILQYSAQGLFLYGVKVLYENMLYTYSTSSNTAVRTEDSRGSKNFKIN